ncbi:hypothetical protein DYB31_016390 [Aphanomyces astaci]|uniref:Uncharacterized protein n=1 Tax=Aphanomyces astaci TaxID=112090 RepID=A0A397ENM0_APHAT|nr:hypothetical protein DYB31_016390 [Aphanomyces astaci]
MDLVLDYADKAFLTEHVYPSWMAEDDIGRQCLSLFAITSVGGYALYLSFALVSYVFIFDKSYEKHPKFLKNQVRLELQVACGSIPFMTLLTLPVFLAEVRGYSFLYDDVSDYGYAYLAFSVAMFMFFNDMMIYWIHRLLHHPLSFETFRPVAEAALREVAKVERPRNEFEQMRGIQTTLAVLESHVVSMRRLLMSLLDNDDDLHMLYLTKVQTKLRVFPLVAFDIYGIQSQISLMRSNIQHTARVVDLLWTSKRNYLLLIDMSLRVMLLMLYCTNYWTGLFGQNIRSDFEDNEALFWGTTVFCAVWTFGAYAVVCKMFLARGLSLSWHKRV